MYLVLKIRNTSSEREKPIHHGVTAHDLSVAFCVALDNAVARGFWYLRYPGSRGPQYGGVSSLLYNLRA